MENPTYLELPYEQTKGKIKYHGEIGIFLEESESIKDVKLPIIGKINLRPLEEVFKISDKFAFAIIFERKKKL